MESRTIFLPFGPDRQIRAVLGLPESPTMDAVLILGHGANNTLDHPVIAGVSGRLVREGVVTVRFNFPYAEEGRKRPDPDNVLENVLALVMEHVAGHEDFRGLQIFAGGKSMGARIAAQLVAKGTGASGLVFLGYPLHPPGKPETLRDKPLYDLPCPALFIEGSRDPFCRFDRLGEVLANMQVRTDVHVLPGLGHSFEAGRGTVTSETLDEVSRVIVAWMESL
ncbi:MAG: dienelactone hydrolase family protein [Deltaproteobacteria bacterium]|nr:dienelactone hydrolase family protein [Deltaproteobacteria bacterium]